MMREKHIDYCDTKLVLIISTLQYLCNFAQDILIKLINYVFTFYRISQQS